MIGTGYARDVDADAVIRSCADALGLERPDLLLAFVGGRHAPDAILRAIRRRFGGVTIVGGAAAGVISDAGFGYSGFEVGLAGFAGSAVTPRVLLAGGLDDDETATARDLGRRVRADTGNDDLVVLLYDSVATTAPLRLHPASRLLDGFHDGLGDRSLHMIGAGTLTDLNLSHAWVFDGDAVRRHAIVALLFPRAIGATTVILHGCRPVSAFLEITRIDGAEVLELDGEPALTVLERILGFAVGTVAGQQLSLVATLGQKLGDPFAPYDEAAYVNRLILRADASRASFTLFEPDFTVGTRVQIMSRDNGLMLESVERGIDRLKREIVADDPVFGFYIDCAGRASVMSGASVEEAELMLRALSPAFPLLGFYSGVEIAPFAGTTSRSLDWTGVLTVLHRR